MTATWPAGQGGAHGSDEAFAYVANQLRWASGAAHCPGRAFARGPTGHLEDVVAIDSSSLEVALTLAGPGDAGELLTLQRAAYATEARIYRDPELPALIQTLGELRAELNSVIALKAVAGHRIVGAVRAHVLGNVLHVGRLTVAPDWQGRGVGSRLLAAVEDHHDGAAETATLFTGHLSAGNLAMYARRGYIEDRREQLRPGVVLVHLTKPLHRLMAP